MNCRQGKIGILAAVLAVSLGATPALAASDTASGNAKAGKVVFSQNCRRCHQAEKERNSTGPFLVGIVGRKAGSAPKFRYSKVVLESGITWNAESLAGFIKSPKNFLAGTKMEKFGFKGLKDDQKIKDLIAYLTDPSAAK